jgi:hypothetical protein
MSSLGSGKEGLIVGEVSTEHAEKAGFAGFGFLWQGEGAKIPGFSMKQAELSGRNLMRGGVSVASDGSIAESMGRIGGSSGNSWLNRWE